jgi:hypothetical protein
MSIQQPSPTFQRLHCLAKYLLENSGFLVEESRIPESSLDDRVRTVMNMAGVLRVYRSQAAAYIPFLMELSRVASRSLRLGNLDGTSAHDLSIELARMVVTDIYGYAGLEGFEEERDPQYERKVLVENFPPVTIPCVFSDWPSGRDVKWVETQVDWEFARVSEHEEEEQRQVVLRGRDEAPIVLGKPKKKLGKAQYNVVKTALEAPDGGWTKGQLVDQSGHGDALQILRRLAKKDQDWARVIHFAGQTGGGYWIR